jgi:protease secretion system membrane fusion protein
MYSMGELMKKQDAVSSVVVHDVTTLGVNTDATRYARMGWLIVLFGVIGSIVWAMMAPLDKGVPVSGTVVVASNRKAVQHPTGGIVAEIMVKEGDKVKEGQVLLRLNDIRNKSEAEISRTQYFNARTTEARLAAERDGKDSIVFPKELEEAKKDPRVASNMSLQTQLFHSRRSAMQSEMGAVDENIAGLKSQLRGIEESRENKKVQKKITQEQVDSMRELARDGYVARSRLLDLERTMAQLNGAIAEDTGNIGRTKRQISELELRVSQRRQEFQRDVRTQLGEVRKEADSLAERLVSQNFDQANSDVKAPVAGTVVAMTVFTKGGVVSGASKLMEIVPEADELEIEGMVPVHLIDKVHAGLKVDLTFPAFNQNTTPHIPGVVVNVSPDRFTDERNGAPFYKMKTKVTKDGLKLLAKNNVISGMPVEMFVKTGERTMMSYLLKPLLDRARTSLTEE